MKGRMMAVVIAAVMIFAVSGWVLVSAEGPRKFVGVKKCAMCHKSEAKGNQYGQWMSTKHAKAFETLATPEAREAAKKAGISGDPQNEPKCVRCHVTAYGAAAESLGDGFIQADGVQCEACHGAGGDYMGMSVMKDKEKAVAAGLVIPNKETCVKCHNTESPFFKEFDYDKFYKKIAHPRP